MNVAAEAPPDLPELARQYAGRVMADKYREVLGSVYRDPPSCSWAWSDYLWAEGCGRPSLYSGKDVAGTYHVGALGHAVAHHRGDTWGAIVVLASLLLDEPPLELTALSALLLAGGWAWITERP